MIRDTIAHLFVNVHTRFTITQSRYAIAIANNNNLISLSLHSLIRYLPVSSLLAPRSGFQGWS